MISEATEARPKIYSSMLRAVAVCTILAALLLCYASYRDPHHFYGMTTTDEPAPALKLTRVDGSAFDLATLKGHAVLVYFGYTSCPEVCPTTLLDISAVLNLLGPSKERVDVVFVTLDPETDVPGVLGPYLRSISPVPIGLTGTQAAIITAAADWGISWKRDSSSGYIDHTSVVALVDPAGHLRTRYSYSQIGDTEAVARDIHHVII